MQETFVVGPEDKKQAMASVGAKARQFRYRMSDYVSKYKFCPDKLAKPPQKQRSGIFKNAWRLFVKNHLSIEFEVQINTKLDFIF